MSRVSARVCHRALSARVGVARAAAVAAAKGMVEVLLSTEPRSPGELQRAIEQNGMLD